MLFLLSSPVLFPLILHFLSLLPPTSARQDRSAPRDIHALSADHLRYLAEADPPEWEGTVEGHLGKLLIPRPVGSKNSTLVQNYISSVFKRLGWHEEQNPFKSETPIGELDFTNLIYTFDPDAPRKIIIAAHFDSKYFPDYPANQFIGATDSAAPCSFMLDLAEAMTPLLQSRRDRLRNGTGILRDGFDEEDAGETTLQLLFLDGEEAFKDWTNTDSIYGARHLAHKWSESFLPPTHPLSLSARRFDPTPSVLSTIDVLVLLDLLGHRSPRIHSYYRETDWLHGLMSSADKRLREAGLVEVESGEEGWFSENRYGPGMIGDDHVPFNQRGVSVLHVISNPFPNVWHSLGDDASALSVPAMNRWNKILRVFTAEYLGLAPESSASSGKRIPEDGEARRSADEL
ncbi:uncharacterized protein MKK02DRAFT_30333 [Dioszegia hungarica]|uniref:Peptide hydrolase n=1 Tax=Dioszegia hungarica TaxID=4972 RepID=A0AA38H4N2_9TREE|nr:uncharacterized protein MKK02DRAFT_30333 [Dioszegia hungarica]KAI9632546.1 hypothetical protein MKK02DRAFT_30333 [Dioszegia hungarica]